MTHLRGLVWAVLVAAALAGCARKPTEEMCEKAVLNIRKLTGHTQVELAADQRAAIRSCRAQSQRDTVQCYESAQTKEQLYACGGELADAVRQAEEKKRSGSAPAPAAPGAAGSGTAPPAPSGSGQ